MHIGATLARLEIFTADPPALAHFHAAALALKPTCEGDAIRCQALGRELVLRPGDPGQLHRAVFRFASSSDFYAHRSALIARGVELVEQSDGTFTTIDPEGRRIGFLAPSRALAEDRGDAREARLQHFGVRSPAPAALLDFYVRLLGFVLSDQVLDEKGELTAAFLRTDAEHHSMAIFRASAVRFDHFSCEAPNWNALRDWADHMAAAGIDLAWGIGRHGPGNDNFLMVRDFEGNLAEISCDLEVCAADRPTGLWPHRPQTLNRWGVALMRS